MASPLTHLEEFATMDKSMCQGVGNGLKTSLTTRNSQVNSLVQQDAAEQVMPGDQRVQMEQEQQQEQQQHATVPEPNAQPSSSSYEEPMQVSTTPRLARNPDDENEMRTVRPRLDMKALINELCERDCPEIDWEKLAMDNSSV